ncbi:MAG: 4Fe-4S binding protein [Acidimicrobiia bacterium]
MAKTTDANPAMPAFVSDYVLSEVDPSYLINAVKPKQFLHIDQSECIMCEGCVDICPWKCIHMVSVAAIDEATNADLPGEDPRDHVAFIVDEDTCTRCALCVDRCPTGVIVLGKVSEDISNGDPHARTPRHGYSYGVRF